MHCARSNVDEECVDHAGQGPALGRREPTNVARQAGGFIPAAIRFALGFSKQDRERRTQRSAGVEQLRGANAVQAALIFLQLLEGHADRLGEGLLRPAGRLALLAGASTIGRVTIPSVTLLE